MNPKNAEKSAAPEPDEAPLRPAPPPSKEKKIKQINKKLKAIQDIKDKIAAGLEVELTQAQKVKTEDALREELEKLMIES